MARPSVLSELTPLPADTSVVWRFIGGQRDVVAMDYCRHSQITGEPVFIIRYAEPGESDRQRPAYASDLMLSVAP